MDAEGIVDTDKVELVDIGVSTSPIHVCVYIAGFKLRPILR